MRLILKYKGFSLVCALFLLAGFVQAQNTTPPPVAPSKDSGAVITSKDVTIEFPEIEGWKRSEVTKYPTPELGYSISYDSPEVGRATIYLYDLGLNNISDDVNSDVLKKEIARTKGEIIQVGQMGYYQDVKELKSDVVNLGGQTGKMKSHHAVFNYSMRGNPLISEIYVLGYKKHFIKIRATYPKVEGEGENKTLADLLAEIEKLLSK